MRDVLPVTESVRDVLHSLRYVAENVTGNVRDMLS